jgi:D-alanyl-D-alanine carboxypeptidase
MAIRGVRSGGTVDGRRRCTGAAVLRVLLAVRAALLAARPAPAAASGATGVPAAPEFTLTLSELRTLTAALPGSIRQRILGDAPRFLGLLSQALDEPCELLVLVDKRHLLPADYVPPDLVPLSRYPLVVSRNDLSLRKAIMPDAQALASAAQAAGVTLLFSSSYRSYDYQRVVYDREVKSYGHAAADRESARPGASQHQLGTAVDFGSITDAFAQTKAGRWLASHAWEYGFTLSYPRGYEKLTGYRWESWHYRYIGRPAARLQVEFFDDVQQYLLEFLHDHRAALDAARVK